MDNEQKRRARETWIRAFSSRSFVACPKATAGDSLRPQPATQGLDPRRPIVALPYPEALASPQFLAYNRRKPRRVTYWSCAPGVLGVFGFTTRTARPCKRVSDHPADTRSFRRTCSMPSKAIRRAAALSASMPLSERWSLDANLMWKGSANSSCCALLYSELFQSPCYSLFRTM